MTPVAFREAVAFLGLNLTTAAPVLGYDPRQVRRYALGEQPVPRVLQNLLAALITLRAAGL